MTVYMHNNKDKVIRINAVKVYVHKFVFMNMDLKMGVYLHVRNAGSFYLSPLNWLRLSATIPVGAPIGYPDYDHKSSPANPNYSTEGFKIYHPLSIYQPKGAMLHNNLHRYQAEYTVINYDPSADVFKMGY